MYPFDSQGKTENYRSWPSTSLRQRRAAPSRDLTVTTVIFLLRHSSTKRDRGRAAADTRGRGGGGGCWGAGLWLFHVNHFCIFLVVTKKKKGFNFIINV